MEVSVGRGGGSVLAFVHILTRHSTMSIGSSHEESTFFRSKKHIMQKLSCTELFCNVSHADFEEHIIPNTQKIKLARETTLFVKCDPVSYVYYVIAGR